MVVTPNVTENPTVSQALYVKTAKMQAKILEQALALLLLSQNPASYKYEVMAELALTALFRNMGSTPAEITRQLQEAIKGTGEANQMIFRSITEQAALKLAKDKNIDIARARNAIANTEPIIAYDENTSIISFSFEGLTTPIELLFNKNTRTVTFKDRESTEKAFTREYPKYSGAEQKNLYYRLKRYLKLSVQFAPNYELPVILGALVSRQAKTEFLSLHGSNWLQKIARSFGFFSMQLVHNILSRLTGSDALANRALIITHRVYNLLFLWAPLKALAFTIFIDINDPATTRQDLKLLLRFLPNMRNRKYLINEYVDKIIAERSKAEFESIDDLGGRTGIPEYVLNDLKRMLKLPDTNKQAEESTPPADTKSKDTAATEAEKIKSEFLEELGLKPTPELLKLNYTDELIPEVNKLRQFGLQVTPKNILSKIDAAAEFSKEVLENIDQLAKDTAARAKAIDKLKIFNMLQPELFKTVTENGKLLGEYAPVIIPKSGSTSVKYYGGDEIGCGGIWITSKIGEKNTSLMLDPGINMSREGQLFDIKYMRDKSAQGIRDRLLLGLMPRIKGLWRDDLTEKNMKLGKKEPPAAGILLSHAHMDHSGNLAFVRPDIPVYVGPELWATLRTLDNSGSDVKKEFFEYQNRETGMMERRDIRVFEYDKPFKVGDLEVIAVRVDHSESGACAFFVNTPEGWVAWTGDLRMNRGIDKSGKYYSYQGLTEKFIAKARELGIKLLFIEGTAFNSNHVKSTEEDVAVKADEVVKKAKGNLVLANFQYTNIERMNGFLDAAKKNGRKLVISSKEAYLLEMRKESHLRMFLKQAGFDKLYDVIYRGDVVSRKIDYSGGESLKDGIYSGIILQAQIFQSYIVKDLLQEFEEQNSYGGELLARVLGYVGKINSNGNSIPDDRLERLLSLDNKNGKYDEESYNAFEARRMFINWLENKAASGNLKEMLQSYTADYIGVYPYNRAEIDVDSAKEELNNDRAISSLIIKKSCRTKDALGSLEQAGLTDAFNEILDMPDLYKHVDLNRLKLDPSIIALLNGIKEQLASNRTPSLVNTRMVNRDILLKLYPKTLERSRVFNKSGKKYFDADILARNSSELAQLIEDSYNTVKEIDEDKLEKTVKAFDVRNYGIPDLYKEDGLLVYQTRKKSGTYIKSDYRRFERLLFTDKSIKTRIIRKLKDDGNKIILGVTDEHGNTREVTRPEIILCLNTHEISEIRGISERTEDTYLINSQCLPFNMEMILAEKAMEEWLKRENIPGERLKRYDMHASGHLMDDQLLDVVKEINPKNVFIVHSQGRKEMASSMIYNDTVPEAQVSVPSYGKEYQFLDHDSAYQPLTPAIMNSLPSEFRKYLKIFTKAELADIFYDMAKTKTKEKMEEEILARLKEAKKRARVFTPEGKQDSNDPADVKDKVAELRQYYISQLLRLKVQEILGILPKHALTDAEMGLNKKIIKFILKTMSWQDFLLELTEKIKEQSSDPKASPRKEARAILNTIEDKHSSIILFRSTAELRSPLLFLMTFKKGTNKEYAKLGAEIIYKKICSFFEGVESESPPQLFGGNIDKAVKVFSKNDELFHDEDLEYVKDALDGMVVYLGNKEISKRILEKAAESISDMNPLEKPLENKAVETAEKLTSEKPKAVITSRAQPPLVIVNPGLASEMHNSEGALSGVEKLLELGSKVVIKCDFNSQEHVLNFKISLIKYLRKAYPVKIPEYMLANIIIENFGNYYDINNTYIQYPLNSNSITLDSGETSFEEQLKELIDAIEGHKIDKSLKESPYFKENSKLLEQNGISDKDFTLTKDLRLPLTLELLKEYGLPADLISTYGLKELQAVISRIKSYGKPVSAANLDKTDEELSESFCDEALDLITSNTENDWIRLKELFNLQPSLFMSITGGGKLVENRKDFLPQKAGGITFYNRTDRISGNIIELRDGESKMFLDMGSATRNNDEFFTGWGGFKVVDKVEGSAAIGLLPWLPEILRKDMFNGESSGIIPIESGKVKAVLLTHGHLDHIESLYALDPDVLIICSEETRAVLETFEWIQSDVKSEYTQIGDRTDMTLSRYPRLPRNILTFKANEPFEIEGTPFKIKPIRVGHSVPTDAFVIQNINGQGSLYRRPHTPKP